MTDLQQLERRIEVLERRGDRWRRLAMGLGLGGVALVSVAGVAGRDEPPANDVIQARVIEIVDEAGRLVLRAGSGPGGGQLDVWTPQGQNVLRFAASEFGGDIALWNAAGANVFGAYATRNGGEAALWNEAGVRSVRVHAQADGGRLDLHDDQDRPLWSAAVSSAGPALALKTPEGSNLANLRAGDAGGRIELAMTGGTPAFAAGATAAGGEGVVFNQSGARTVRLHGDEHGGRVDLLNELDQPLWSAAAGDRGGRLELRDAANQPLIDLTGRDTGGSFTLRNAQGVAVVLADADASGAGMLSVADAAGQPRVSSGAGPAGGIVQVASAEGSMAATLTASEETHAGRLALYGRQGVPLLTFSGNEGDGGRLEVLNDSGRAVCRIEAVKAVGAAISLFDAEGTRNLAAASRLEGGLMSVLDPGGMPLVVLGPSATGQGGSLAVINGRNTQALEVGVDRRGAGLLTLWDALGNIERVPKETP